MPKRKFNNHNCKNAECKNCKLCEHSDNCSEEFKKRKQYIDDLFRLCIKRRIPW